MNHVHSARKNFSGRDYQETEKNNDELPNAVGKFAPMRPVGVM